LEHDLELHILHQAIFGRELEKIDDPDMVLKMLKDGKSDIITSMKWGEKRGNELHDVHKIVLQKIEGDRVIFFNPLAHPEDMEKGTFIEGENMGPRRRVEGIGLESVSVDEFIELFEEREGISYFPEAE